MSVDISYQCTEATLKRVLNTFDDKQVLLCKLKFVDEHDHKLATVKGCVEAGLKPDFWMKTLHHHRYWSGRNGKDECDNLWCDKPDETIAYMRERPEPWIAFKILAAGAIRPADGFRYALKAGADFLCVGMYDFQLVEDTNIALDALAENQKRERPWRA